ncbi:MAG: ribosome recycling factor [Planctomycetota bacterium]|nr:ribosome recycling factor [Planctomycetota bacterium]MDA1138808.1 ribosome recycling factor [Planctomycetota bacterium]
MPVDEILFEAEEKMENAVAILEKEYRTIRTGRASPALVDNLKVDAYGVSTPLKQLGSVGAPDPRQLVIRPFDRGTIGDIEKAIMKSDLGLQPNNDGKLIRIPIPPLSEERRRQLSGRLKEMAEEARVSIRNVRRDANKQIDAEKKDGLIPEDSAFTAKEATLELTKKFEANVTRIFDAKTTEVMEV